MAECELNQQHLCYLDYNATTPISSEVRETIQESLAKEWGNASSSHVLGQVAKDAIQVARHQVADMIEADPGDVIFTSGGTESNHTVLNTFGLVASSEPIVKMHDVSSNGCAVPYQAKLHVITSTIEHDSIKLPLEQMEKHQLIEVSYVPVNPKTGMVDVTDVMAAIRPNTALISIMLANNETGILQPVKEISAALKWYCQSECRTVYLHTDAAQAIGKVPVSVKDLDVHYLTIVGHKFYGPRIGALYVKNLCNNSTPFRPTFIGGGQERGYRSGTENTAMITGLGRACELVSRNIDAYQKQMALVRDELEQILNEKFGSRLVINFVNSKRLPNTSSISFVGDGFRGKEMLANCSYVIAGVGAACHSQHGNDLGSAILRASGLPCELARNTLRLSVGRDTTLNEVRRAVDDLVEAWEKLSKSLI